MDGWMGGEGSPGAARRGCGAVGSHLIHAAVEELEAAVAVAGKGAVLDELREELRAQQLRVELLVRPLPGLQEG